MEKEWSMWGNERYLFDLLMHSEGSSIKMLEIILQEQLSEEVVEQVLIPSKSLHKKPRAVFGQTSPLLRRVSSYRYREETILHKAIYAHLEALPEGTLDGMNYEELQLEKLIDSLETKREILYAGYENNRSADVCFHPVKLKADLFPVKEYQLTCSGSVCFLVHELFDAELILRHSRRKLRKEIFM
ncbi:hypothetical protein ACFVVQ_05570 [Paenibacillus chitinolyticus]|uniref:hypothetical protein n=1 Tax=Paenibacillus TaxID=44249 RepID=UPI001C30C99C|nr:hypothetical protein [Paenibacillus sp. GbtcB18]